MLTDNLKFQTLVKTIKKTIKMQENPPQYKCGCGISNYTKIISEAQISGH